MEITFQELEMYKDFDELASDVLDLAKEILPDQLLYLSSIRGNRQLILKHSDHETSIPIVENMMLSISDSLCSGVDFDKKQPLIYEDTRQDSRLDHLRAGIEGANIRSYLGIPISLVNGEKFGTLCAVNDEVSRFDDKSINLLQRIVRMFSYYLNLERFAYRDSLTDLYNRRYLTRFYNEYAVEGGAMFFLDLDGFKKVNDVHGHDAGDLVLKKVASKIQLFVNERNDKAFAVRLGGDEFLIHFPDGASEEEMSHDAEQILDSLSTWEEGYQLSTSIGIVTYPPNGKIDLDVLLKNADTALYRAKTAGKNTYKIF
ncbi:sensor domain-containing diguanylate cyclase [Planococcus sp. CPCC 101016]|uniref:sensor domain-containing diguanylate cyclase n=1 Tax=Planococcus sp. CPCC 101016 TaxID=2599617 RepID=UPI0011B5DAAA|nr:sensor domain-containing diguanylate cyclase [Planococcus sp. CPCC 101016]TWT05570.1 sensor domain-containing diguanylate cyclase [Planococcus sp. CPCC 101016]